MFFVTHTLFYVFFFFFSSRRRHTRFDCDWSSDVCSSDLFDVADAVVRVVGRRRVVDRQKHPRDRLEEEEEERGRAEDVDPGGAPGDRLVEQSLLDGLPFEPAIQPGGEAGGGGEDFNFLFWAALKFFFFSQRSS